MANDMTPDRANDVVRPESKQKSNDFKSSLSTLFDATPLLGKNRIMLLALVLIGVSFLAIGGRPELAAAVVIAAIIGVVFLIARGVMTD